MVPGLHTEPYQSPLASEDGLYVASYLCREMLETIRYSSCASAANLAVLHALGAGMQAQRHTHIHAEMQTYPWVFV